MAWEKWLKDDNEEPKFSPIKAVDENADYANPEWASFRNGAIGFLKSFPGAVALQAGVMENTAPSISWDLQSELENSDIPDDIYTKAAINNGLTEAHHATAPVWGAIEKGARDVAKAMPKDLTPDHEVGKVRGFFDTVLQNAPQMMGQAAISAVNPYLGATMMGASIAGDQYLDLRDKGVDPLTAGQASLANAAIQSPLEYLGMDKWINARKIMQKHGLLKGIGSPMAEEGITEAIQEVPDEMTSYIAEHGNLDGFDYGQLGLNAAEAGAVGAFYGGLFGGLNYRRNKNAQQEMEEVLNGNSDNAESTDNQNTTSDTDNDPNTIDVENTYNGTGTNRPTYTRESAPNPAMYVMSRLVGSGIDEQTAAGIVGGLMQESGGNTVDLSTTAENSSGAYGIAQWLDRRGALEAFAKERGTDPSDLDTQIDFLIHELQGSEGEALSKIKGAKSVEEAGVLADQYYERSEGTDEIRSQKSKNARTIYDAYVNGGSPVSGNIPNMNNANNEKPPKSAKEFLRDMAEAEVATNASGNTDISKINEINDVLKNGSKQDVENLARKLGWMGYDNKVVSDTPQTTGLPTSQSNGQNAQETPNNASTTVQKQAPVVQKQVPVQQPKPITVPNKNLKNISEKKAEPLPGDTGSFARNAEKPKEQEGGIVPQPTSSSFPRESLGIYNRDVQGQAPSKPVLPQRDNPNSISQNRPSYGNANRQVGIKVNPQTIKNGLKNKYLRNLVKQAFVDGNREAMERLSAYKVKAPVLEAVKEDVIPNYRKVTPQEQQAVQPQSDTYTPTYRNREDLNRGMTEGQRNRDTGYVPEANEGAPISRQWKTPQEAMEAGRLADANTNAYESEPTERNKKADKDLKSRIRQEKKDERNAEKSAKAKEKAQKAEEAKAKREAKQAEEEHRRRVKEDGYTPIYRNRSDIDSHYRNSSTNKSDEVDVSGGNGSIESKRASSPSEAMKADNRESANTNHYSTEKVKRDKKADEDLKSRIRQEESERKARETKEKEEPIHEEKKPEKEDYHIRYGNKKEAMGHLKDTSDNSKKDVSVNGSDRSIPTKWRTPQEAMEGMRRQGETAINREANKDTHTTTKQERNTEADKNLKEKIQKEKTNESTNNKPQVRELLHRPEENKGGNTKSQQTGKQEGTTSEAGKEKQSAVKKGDTVTVKGEKGTYTVDAVVNKNGTNKPALVLVRGIDRYVKPEEITVIKEAEGVWKNPFKGDKLQKGIHNREVARFRKKEAQKARYQKGKKVAKDLYENTKKEIQNVLDGYRKGKGNKDVAGKAITAWRNKLNKDLSENADTKGLKFKDLEKDLNDFIKAKRDELQNAKRGEKVETAPAKEEPKNANKPVESKTIEASDDEKEYSKVVDLYMSGNITADEAIKKCTQIFNSKVKTVEELKNNLDALNLVQNTVTKISRMEYAKNHKQKGERALKNAEKNRTDKEVADDDKARKMLGNELYNKVYRQVVISLREDPNTRDSAFESALLFSKMSESFKKNYGINIPLPFISLIKAKRRGNFIVAGNFNRFKNVLHLALGANREFTLLHEGAHWYDFMLRSFSNLSNKEVQMYFGDDIESANQAIKKMKADLKVIDEWAGYSDEKAKEYKGTALMHEFDEYIKGTRSSTVSKWIDAQVAFRAERFARGFEQYLMDGKAPTKELKGVFERFKQWMIGFYRSQMGITSKPLPPKMKRIYDSMINGGTTEAVESEGKSTTVRTDDGKEFKATYKIVPADSLISSSTYDFAKNENYPSELQPRDRDRVSMREQVDDMARNLSPQDLAESRNVNEGAPLINQDNVVENGNGRTMAITRAYKHGGEAYNASAKAYKQFLMDNAEKFGYTKEQVEAMENPVLVRQRDSSSNNLQDSIIHSTNGGMKMSASQQAQADVKKLTAKTLAKYNYDGSGDLTLESNRDFVTSVLNEVSDKSDRDVLFDKDGKPSKAGIERVRAAMTAAAYGNTELLDRMSESTDNDMQNVIKAYVSVAPRVASIRMRMENGEIGKDYNLPKVLSDALDFYFKCKAENKPVKFALNETGLFSDGKVTLPNETVGNFVRFMDDNVRKPRKISDSIEQMVKYVDGANEGSMSLMPDAQMNLGEIVSASTEEMNQKYLVTNANLHGDDTVSVTRANGKLNANEPASSIKKRLIKMLKGETFTTTADGIALKANNSNNVGHVATSDHYDSQPLARRALLAKKSTIESLIKNAVYVEEQQNKYDPNLPTHFVQLYTAAKFRGKYYRVKISAKKNADGTYTVTDANLYNIDLRGEIDKSAIKKASSPTHSQVRDKLQVTNTPLDTITVADLLNGVNDGNGNPYVVNGKLQYENGVKSIKNLLSETTDSEPITHHSVEEMKAQTMSNFPNAQNVEDTGTHLSFDLPNGEHVEADFTNDTISVNRVKAQQDYGGTLKGDEKALGKLETAGREAFMTLSLDNVDETPSHEAMHLAMKFLTDRERNALFKLYKNEEAICEAYRKWRIARKARQGALLGKIFQKISDFANKVLSLFRENDKNIFRKVSEGQVWERPINNEAAKHVSYMMDLSHVQEGFEQKYIEEAKDKVKTAIKGKNYNNDHITVKERPKDNDWSVKEKILNNTFSPSRTTDPVMKRLYELADTATRLQQKLKTQWTERLAMAKKLIKTAEQMKAINALLWAEDAEQHVYTDEEMRAQGIDEDVIKAHNIIRRLLSKMYQTINDTYTRATIKSKVFGSREDAEARVREAQASPYEEVIGEIRQVNQNGNIGYQVSIKSPHSTKYEKVEMTAAEFKAIKEDKYNVVTSVTKLSNGNYSITWKSYVKPLTNMEGYMPHFFHDFMIIRKREDGKAEVVGSATSLEKAVAKAEKMYSDGGGDFLISPKSFQFEGELENPVVMGDKDYRKLINNIVMNSTMSLKDAQSVTQARMKGRHTFLGELKKRKGAEGFEDNAIWAIQHHIDASARYCALDPFKVKATNLFERAYGDSKKDYGRGTKQAFAKGYIESMMGKPTEGELFVNKILRHVPGLKNTNRPARLLTGMLTHTVGVLKLGASPAAGFVNLMQIFNANGYLGSRRVAVGIKRAMHPTIADLRILKALGVDEEVGLADSDFGKVRLEDSKLGRIADRYTKLADKLMLPFSTAEKTIRRATVLAAYYKYMEEHQGETDIATLKKRAGNYAMEINRKVNFDYSTADAPRIFRAVQGTVIGDLALQFQKYGVKELEVIGDFLPYFGKQTTTKQRLEFFGYYLAVAGMWNAFPFQDLLMSILGWMFGDDPEKMAKKAMMEWAGNDPMCKALVNVANYGAGSLVGMDISQRVGLKGVVPEVSGGGPLASTTIGLAKAIINSDTNGAMKSISPALGNIYGAIEGYNTDSKGRKTVDYGDWGTADGAWNRTMRALGFRTVKEATATDAQNIIYNYKDQKKNAREKAKSEYFKNPSSDNIKKLKDLGYTDKQIKDFKDNKNSTRVERAQSGLSKDDMKKLKPVFDYAN